MFIMVDSPRAAGVPSAVSQDLADLRCRVFRRRPRRARSRRRRRQLGQDRERIAVVEHDDRIGRDRDAHRIGRAACCGSGYTHISSAFAA